MITLFTDFGIQGPYTGQLRAVLLDLCPEIPHLELFSDLPVQNVRASAYLLPAYTSCLPEHTVNLCIVDPGVGGERKALAIKADRQWFVGPDNGLFSLIVRRAEQHEIRQITWRPDSLSSSFHGRDLFAPVAAMLASGRSLPDRRIEMAEICLPDWPEDLYEIIYIDRYGNAITGVRARQIDRRAILRVAGQSLSYARTFCEQEEGQCFWYENSNGLIEIAANRTSASELLGLQIADPIDPDG